MPTWCYVDSWEESTIPSKENIVISGVKVGYNLAERDCAIIASNKVSMAKICYYNTGGNPPYNIGILTAIKHTEYQTLNSSDDIIYYTDTYDGTTWNTVRSLKRTLFSSTYGDFNYLADSTRPSQVIDTTRKSYIPYYQTLNNALSALNDGAWYNPATADPYSPTGGSSGGGGGGINDTSDDIGFPLPPAIGAISSGFLTLFLPTLSQINDLANYMWSTSFDIDAIRKLFANPMDAILGCYILPISPAVTGSKSVKVAGVAIPGYTWNYTAQEYITLTCGGVDVPKKTGSYLDYEPTTKLQIFLPFIGFREINADDCMGKTLSLQYNIHTVSGACVASLKCGNTVLYQWAGQCSMQIPISGADLSNAITAALGIATSAVAIAATSGASAPMVAGTLASAAVNSMNLKPRIERGGSMAGAAGFMSGIYPYIVRSNPEIAIPENQNKFIGYPSFTTVTLSTLAGYNEIDSIHLENIPGTDAEIQEIETLLRGGVIF